MKNLWNKKQVVNTSIFDFQNNALSLQAMQVLKGGDGGGNSDDDDEIIINDVVEG